MPAPHFVVPVADIEKAQQSLNWEISSEWLTRHLAGTEATPRGPAGQLSVHLAKNGPEILVQGNAKVALTMPCARTLDPVDVDVSADIYLLLEPRAASAPTGAKQRRRRGRSGRSAEDTEGRLSNHDAARDTFDSENVVLDDFVREHILLELPMFPLRSDLRSSDSAGIAPPSETAPASEDRRVDPRLQPLAEMAERMRKMTNKE